jgi:hypothetical protein
MICVSMSLEEGVPHHSVFRSQLMLLGRLISVKIAVEMTPSLASPF